MKLSLCLALILAPAALANAQSLSGLWDATVKFNDFTVPFPIEFSQNATGVAASFFNGDDRVTSTSGNLTGNTVTVNFDDYATKLIAIFANGELKGTYGGARYGVHEFEAKPHANITPADVKPPDIAGVWYMANETDKGEHAWRLIVKQKGSDASASILRIDGDTGALVGGYQDGKFALNHFDGARASFLELVPKPDGTLAVTYKTPDHPALHLTAVPLSQAVADNLPPFADPENHTHIKNAGEPFHFSFPDLSGKLVSNTDPRFKDKVVLINVTDSGCPNCRDEALFLQDLYRRYHSQGLEIVALDFEEPQQLKNPVRLRAFIKKYGIEYTYLIAGEPDQLQAKVPQADHLNSWPTTFFLGRDGKVRATHAGFVSPATGSFNASLKRQMTERLEQLLSDNARASR